MTTTNSLKEIQNLLQKSIQDGCCFPEVIDCVLEKPPLSTKERLSIYHDAYAIRLRESLRDDFSSVELQVGSDKFESIAKKYILEHPSKFQNLAEYSEEFPKFLENQNSDLAVLAYQDWYRILSDHVKLPEKKCSAEDIANGLKFCIQVLPSSLFKKINNTYFLVYKCDGEVLVLDINEEQYQLLRFFEKEKNVEEVSDYIDQEKLNESEILNLVQEWIKKQILYCKPLK